VGVRTDLLPYSYAFCQTACKCSLNTNFPPDRYDREAENEGQLKIDAESRPGSLGGNRRFKVKVGRRKTTSAEPVPRLMFLAKPCPPGGPEWHDGRRVRLISRRGFRRSSRPSMRLRFAPASSRATSAVTCAEVGATGPDDRRPKRLRMSAASIARPALLKTRCIRSSVPVHIKGCL
jgi:hypothetical protein